AQAKDAVKQASLDRVRAEIASMRTTSDLERITPLIWKELKVLGIPFIRCGVFIMDDVHQVSHTYLSTPDGKAVAAFDLPYNAAGNIIQIVQHWQDKKIYTEFWDEAAYTAFGVALVENGIFTSTKQYLSTLPGGGFYIHFIPFLQGMLYVGNTSLFEEEVINLIQSLANAFSTAYARYEDFNKLDAAKQQVDKTLIDLKQTQQLLIQAEKMASLGQLTAGIAHEIQNPLNFITNFSVINAELINEMKEEIGKGNLEEVSNIADNLKTNEEKINHHGKRADAIVKGMLQHTQSRIGQKEPTDLNDLCDEYLRLSYHGLRAKDKTFNADIKTDFDEAIKKINIVPQEIGRVLLNLFNNAFYAVNEKKEKLNGSFEPKVVVATKKEEKGVIIKVVDNGFGIPQSLIDKIYQPFFTTKPTGQGTGLGLSLSYDVIMAHEGTIKVETKEGEGSSFIVELPV
ncbi:MAG TPA: ATP-binding protein, partial [Chitinophagaceae bacterium]|nr:ATP-binding protein [Chitinophagaceae bacterium]